jgi:hypothetical protein
MAGVGLGYAFTLALAIDRIVFDAEERRWFHRIIGRESARILGTIGFGESNERTA